MLQDEYAGAEQATRSLQRQNSQILMSKNPQAKTQYLDKQKTEMNNLKKENLNFQEEIKSARRGEEKAIKKVEEFIS